MRLFKCYDPCIIEEPSQCLGIYARDKESALRKMASIQSELENYDEPYETVMNSFKMDEIFIDSNSDCYFCYSKDMSYESDVRVIFLPFNEVKNVEEYIMNELAMIESQESYFIEHVNDKAINMSFAERFFKDSKGYIYEPSLNLDGTVDVRQDIKDKAAEQGKSINTYIDEDIFIHNVNEFFGDNVSFRDEYLSYIFADDEPFFTDEFYKYCARKLIGLNEWSSFDIHLVDIVAE